MPNFSSFRWEMTEIYRKDRPTDIVMYRGNYSQLKNIFLLQTQPISSRESSCQISVQSDKKWLRLRHCTSSDSGRAGCEPPQEQNSWHIRHASVIIKGRRSRQNPFIDQSTTKETSSLEFSCVIDTLLWSYRFNNISIEEIITYILI